MDELISFSFSSSTWKLTVSSLTLVENPKTAVLDPLDTTLSGSIVSKDRADCRAPKYAINPRISAYIDGEKCAFSDDVLMYTWNQKNSWASLKINK